MYKLSFILLIAVAMGCGPRITSTTTTSSANKHSEDLSSWRPKETPADTAKNVELSSQQDVKLNKSKVVQPRLAMNDELDMILDSISEYNLVNGYVDGFTIQIYSGIKREEALNAKKQLSIALPEFEADLQYVQPNFRVRSGKYYDRLAAQKDYLAIKKHFPDAIVIPDRIPISK